VDSSSAGARPQLDVRRAADRFVTRTDWATTRHSFSFGAHYDPGNVGFGSLLAVNEDLVRSGTGYDPHPHVDAEIVTWVLSGSLVHQDSRGHSGVVYPGLAQRMSAGSGIVHSERNDAYRTDPTRPEEPVHFWQLWVRPDISGGEPSYQQRELDLADLDADWLPVASGSHPDAVITLGSAGSTLWAVRVAAGVARQVPDGPLIHLSVLSGEVDLESAGRLTAGDSVRVRDTGGLRVTGVADAEVLAWVMAERERAEGGER
jgi:redox-sensitive bicupin YhaK (pirin superfamily)